MPIIKKHYIECDECHTTEDVRVEFDSRAGDTTVLPNGWWIINITRDVEFGYGGLHRISLCPKCFSDSGLTKYIPVVKPIITTKTKLDDGSELVLNYPEKNSI